MIPKTMEPRPPAPKSVVKGPIRCHKCQLLCANAEQYLNHSRTCGKIAAQ
jgi:hypothetical protein